MLTKECLICLIKYDTHRKTSKYCSLKCAGISFSKKNGCLVTINTQPICIKSTDRLYGIYYKMMRRCYDIKSNSYRYYGQKNIQVCDDWRQNKTLFFTWALSNGYENNLTIDRIDSKGNYEPSNCRWISKSENSKRAVTPRFNESSIDKYGDKLLEMIKNNAHHKIISVEFNICKATVYNLKKRFYKTLP